METRSGSIKDPIYYPSGSENLDQSNDVESSARSSGGSQELCLDESASLKVPRKFITNWRQACDRTRDRTKDLLKRWRTVPSNTDVFTETSTVTKEIEHPGWSVHVWSKFNKDFDFFTLLLIFLLLRLRFLLSLYNLFSLFSFFFFSCSFSFFSTDSTSSIHQKQSILRIPNIVNRLIAI